jgi:hypothetical protein
VAGFVVTLITVGNCDLTASQAGDTNHNAASPVTATIVINFVVGKCQGAFACAGIDPAIVAEGSCNGDNACQNATGPIGANACNGIAACQSSGTVGAISCNGDNACKNATGPIGTNACNGANICIGNIEVVPDCQFNAVVPAACFTLVDVKSRKIHGSAGPFDLIIERAPLIDGAVTVEPRSIGNGHMIVFRFSGPISSPGTATVVPVGEATATHTGDKVFVTLTNVPDNQRVTITLANVGGSASANPVSMGFLVGDVNNKQAVNAADISAIKANVNGPPLDATTYIFDLNADGAITPADVSMAKARAGLMLR